MSMSLQPNNQKFIPVPDEVLEYDESDIEHIVLETGKGNEDLRDAA